MQSPQCVYRFVACFTARVPSPAPSHAPSQHWRERKKDRALSVTTPCPEWVFSHSFAHSLLTRPSSTRTTMHSGPQTAIEHLTPPPLPAEVLGPGNRTCPLRTASEIRLDVRRCAYWRSTALRLSTSRKSQPDQSQRTPCFPPWWQAVFAPMQSWIWLLLNIFGNFKNPFRPQLSQMLKAFLVVLLDDVQFLRWTEAITVSEMGEDSNSMTTFV